MSITKWYKIVCNYCGCAQQYQGSRESAEQQHKDFGGIVVKKKHYCDNGCKRLAQKGDK